MDNKEQIAFFERLKTAMPTQYNMAGEIAEILGVSPDSVYRRMRGETALTYKELLLIQQELNLKESILFPLENIEEVNFIYARPAYGYDTYLFLQEITNQMNLVHRREGLHILLSSDDLPFFLHFLSPALLQFKLLVFSGRDIHDAERPEEHDPAFAELANTIIKRWLEASSEEVWGSNPLDSTLRQIAYSYENELISLRYATMLLQELNTIVDIVKAWATSGKKDFNGISGGPIELYQSEINMGEMNLMLTYGEEMAVYKSNYGYGYLKTEHPVYCDETMQWVKDLESKGILISGSGERFRNRYIGLLRESIRKTATLIGAEVTISSEVKA